MKEDLNNKYLPKNLNGKRILQLIKITIDFSLSLFFAFMLLGMLLDFTPAFGFALFTTIIFTYLLNMRLKNLIYIEASRYYANYFVKYHRPFIDLTGLPSFEPTRGISIYSKPKFRKNTMNIIKSSLKKGYLINCTLEIHDGKVKVALAKEVAKDVCPNCGAPIVGVFNETYVCKYCGCKVFDVLQKKTKKTT